MKNIFPASPGLPHLRTLGLALGLPLLAGQALAQQSVIPTTPTTVFGLGYNAATNATFLIPINPANLNNTSGLLAGGAINLDLTNLVAGQRVVAIDGRPSTGQIYALGYDNSKTTANARLYTLTLNAAGTAYLLNPIGTAPVLLSLDLQDPSKGAVGSTFNTIDFATVPRTPPQLTNIGFDFNPRADRIRVVGPRSSGSTTAGITYVLNPNTGDLTSPVGTPVTGVATSPIRTEPTYVGAVAYTNSSFGLSGTTLYDLGINNTNGSVSTQNITTGALTQQSVLSFATLNGAGTGYSTFAELNSPTIRLDLDFYYDRGGRRNVAYVVEARRNPANNGYSSNLYTLDFSTGQSTSGQAVGKNIFGGSDANTPAFIYDIAALSTSPKVWIGKSTTAPTAWNDDANWFPAGRPTNADDVLIPGNGTFVAFGSGYTITTQPTVSTSNAIGGSAPVSEALSVTLTNGAVLTLANNGTLNVYGDFVNTDSQVQGSGTGTLNLLTDPNGNAVTHDLGGNVATTFPNVSVSTGITASTSQAVAITRALTVAGNLAIGTNQSFTLLSSASGTAYVVNQGSGLVTGTATVQRYITPTNTGLGYRHYSSPVSNSTVADLATAGFTPVVNSAYNSANTPRQVRPYPTVFTYEQSRLATSNASYAVGDFDNGFLSPDNTGSALTVGQGYVVNIGGTQLVDFQGTLNQNANYSRTGLARGAQVVAGYHLLGNPYPGAISYTTLYGASSGVQDGLYVYKSTGQYTGAYAAYLSNGQSTNGGTDNVPLGQGFFLRVAPGSSGNVNFTAAARTNQPETALFQRTTGTTSGLAMTLSGNNVANQTRIYFDANATVAFDNGYDADYLPASHGLDLASDISPEALAINGLPALTGTVTVPLQLHAAAAGTYTLAVDELANLPVGYHAYLRDGRTGTYTDLAATPSLSLTLAPADAPTGRYAVVFATSQPLASAPAALAALVGVYPNPARGTATLVLPQALRGQASSEVTLVNTLGQVVLRRTVAAGTSELVELPLGSLAAGIYTVRATTATGAVAKQLRVE